MNGMTQKELLQLDAMADRLRQRIRTAPDRLTIGGTVYYVAADGCDDNDGSSPAAAWRTLEKVSAAPLLPGDGVLFRRGDVFRGSVYTKPGVTYGAYGTGEKPRLYGWQEDLAVPALWECVDAVHHIWRYIRKIPDVGVLVFNDGERHSGKLIPSYIGGRFVCREDESRAFVMAAEMRHDLDIYWHFEERFTTVPSKGECFPVPDVNGTRGELYLRCDAGNPGEAFASIEAAPRACMFYVGGNENVRIDNLCLKYIGIHAVSGGGPCVKNLCVTGCEIGWVGGTIQHYFGTDPNYPQGGRGTVTRYGNGVEIYGGCDGYTVADCYIYQMYDAGITHQVTTSGQTYKMKDVCYRGNLVEHCVYSIEYFLDVNDGGTENLMENVEICGNVLRYAGCGWGQQRHNKDTPAHIKGWSYRNPARGYRIHHNVFDRAAYRMLHLVCHKPESLPVMDSNIYIQYADGLLGQYGANETAEPPVQLFDAAAEEIIASVFGDKNAGVYRIG